jgi:hypothetical protein
MHRLAPERSTLPLRRSGNTVYVVHQSTGISVIAGQSFGWEPGDMFVVPSWAPVEHRTELPADLFTLSDTPVSRALGAVDTDAIVDVTGTLPWPHDPDGLTAGWWRGLCRDFTELRPDLEKAARCGTPLPLESVRLLAPVLNPSKIVACTSNYSAHVEEMHKVQRRTLGRVESWMMTLLSGDVIFTGAPPGVGPIRPGDLLETRISRLGAMTLRVR